MYESFGKVALSCYLRNYWLLRLDSVDNSCLESKNELEKKLVFIIECVTHTENDTSSCYLGNYRLLRLDYEDNSCLEIKKQLVKKILFII